MKRRALRFVLAAGLLAVASLAQRIAAADTLFGQTYGEEAGAADEGWTVYRAAGFDPIEDVACMKNWSGNVRPGHCYAVACLVYLFSKKVEFTGQAGLPLEDFGRKRLGMPFARGDGKKGDGAVLRLEGEKAFEALAYWLSGKQTTRLPVGPYRSLRDMTRPGREGETWFRKWAEAMQTQLQIGAEAPRAVANVVRANLGFLPGCGKDDVNKNSVKVIRNRMAKDGEPVPFSLHPVNLQAKGHVMVAYELRESDEKVEIVAYDNNVPPTDAEARPTLVTVDKTRGWRYTAVRADGREAYAYDAIMVPKPDGSIERRMLRRILGDLEESQERNTHLGDLIGQGRSIPTRIKGGAKLVLEILNPF